MNHFFSRCAVIVFLLLTALQTTAEISATPAPQTADVLIIGAGMAGLSAALESARGGANVLVIDMASVFGGHAVMAGGDITIIDTPLQRAKNIKDSPDLAYGDFMRWGIDNNAEWVRYYVDHSREEIYDWLVDLGVEFTGVRPYPGSSVARAHKTKDRGLGLVAPVYRACLKNPNIRFAWNTKVLHLIVNNGRVVGAMTKNERTGESKAINARAVILATGGFQSNLALVKQNWPKDKPMPERLLAGSGINSVGSGLDLAREVGGTVSNMDHQWNYQQGLPDPRYPETERGVSAGNKRSIWVNAQGNRFVNEEASSPETLSAVLKQKPATYWAIFDERAKDNIFVAGTGWNDASIEHWIVQNPAILQRADSIEALAKLIGLPEQALSATVSNYNVMVNKGLDVDFERFGKPHATTVVPPIFATIVKPPFYALRFYPLTRKSMGGINIDLSCRVIDATKHPILGFYAAGEATGLAGINGQAALEGTFLGPSVVTGRVAARAALSDMGITTKQSPTAKTSSTADDKSNRSTAITNDPKTGLTCTTCHEIKALIALRRPGYWHFERVHGLVIERKFDCLTCHKGISASFDPQTHKIDRMLQSNICSTCHNSE